jgi:chromosome segregation protein
VARRRLRAQQADVAGAVATGADLALGKIEESLAAAQADREAAEQASKGRTETLKDVRARVRVIAADLDRVVDTAHGAEVSRAEQRLRLEQFVTRAAEEFGVDTDALVAEYGPDVPVPMPEEAEPAPPRRRRGGAGAGQSGPSQNGSSQDGPSQDGPSQDGPSQDGPSQDGAGQNGAGQNGAGQNGAARAGAAAAGAAWAPLAAQAAGGEPGTREAAGPDGTAEAGRPQVGPPQVGPPQVGPPQVSPAQVGPAQVGPPQGGQAPAPAGGSSAGGHLVGDGAAGDRAAEDGAAGDRAAEASPAGAAAPVRTIPYVRAEQEKRAATAQRQLDQLGKVNPLALEEYAALEERHQFLATQLEDLKKTRRDLLTVVKEVDDRVQQVFTAAFADTASEFEQIFARLFPGGEGRLVLTEPDDMLATGIDVEARPPGKKVKRLSLLSGGERSLTAIAFLLAIFKARPSPFYVLDEVEAALDDTNLQRLLGIFEELRSISQLIIITHQKRTMEVADALYGTTMQGDGVSTVVSQRLRERERA